MMNTTNSLPPDFDWESYLELNPDLGESGIYTREIAIRHFYLHGHSEKRLYTRQFIEPNPKYENASVIIVGTSREVEIFEDRDLAKRIEERIPVLCINTAFHYFKRISCLFLNGRFHQMDNSEMATKSIDEIYAPFAWECQDSLVRHFRIKVDTKKYCQEISTDLNNTLPHGPTTMLDIVFPFCAFHKVRTIYIIGAEYQIDIDDQIRHAHDSRYINRSILGMDRKLEYDFAIRKLVEWSKYFDMHQIKCYALSNRSNTPFKKKSLEEILTG